MRGDLLTELSQQLAFLSYVEKHPNSRIEQAATYFSVSKSTIKKWVNSLWIVGHRTANQVEADPQDMINFDASAYEDGYLILYDDLDTAVPLHVSAEDADLVISTVQAIAGMGYVLDDLADSLSLKLALISGSAGAVRRSALSQLEEVQLKQIHAKRSCIETAIANNHRLRLEYLDAGQRSSSRVVSPATISYQTEVPILVCWCHQQDDVRRFRLDRITKIEEVPQKRDHVRQAKSAGTGVSAAFTAEIYLQAPAPLALESLGWPEANQVDRETLSVKIPVADYDWLTRWVGIHADSVLQITPEPVRVEVLKRLRANI